MVAVPGEILRSSVVTATRGRRGRRMRVELLYFDGCPNWTLADERLAQALRAVHRDDVTVARCKVETTSQAEALGFTGSPTVRVDGVDPFATGDEQVGLACRVYLTPDGLSGSPTVAQLVEVLRAPSPSPLSTFPPSVDGTWRHQ